MTNEKPKTLSQLIAAFNKAPKDETTREALRSRVGRVACFVMAGSKPDPAESAEAFEFHNDTGTAVDGALTFDEMVRQLSPEHEADPVTGRALFKGKTTDGLKVDWSQVPRERRLVAAFAAESGQLPAGATSETVAEALLEENPRAPWPRLIEAWDKLRTSTKPADRARVLGIEARLVFTKEAASEPRPFAAVLSPDAVAPPATSSGGPTRVLVIASDRDQSFVNALLLHAAQLVRTGRVEFVGRHNMVAGRNVATQMGEWLATCPVAILITSANLGADCWEDTDRVLAQRATRGLRVVPILARPSALDERLGQLRPLPINGKPISGWPSPDEAWCEVMAGLRRLLEALG